MRQPSGNSQPSQTRSQRSRSLTQNVLATNPCPTNGSDNPEPTNPGARQTFPPQSSVANRAHKLRIHKLWPGCGSGNVLILRSSPTTTGPNAQDASRRKSYSCSPKRQLAGGGHVFGRAAFDRRSLCVVCTTPDTARSEFSGVRPVLSHPIVAEVSSRATSEL